MADSTKPNLFQKPRPDFPLFPHQNGRWAKKVRGKLHYFGKCADDPDGVAAEVDWERKRATLQDGRTWREPGTGDGPTVAAVCDKFLEGRKALLGSKEISPHTLNDYVRICKLLVGELGDRLVSDLVADDFEKLRAKLIKHGHAPKADKDRGRKGLGLVALGNHIQRIRTVLRSARNSALNDLMLESFKKPSPKALRINRAEQGPKMFEPAEVKTLLDKAGPQMKAMMLLALNVGFGNNDCGQLPTARLNLETGWHDFPRPKTGALRRAPLWPETVEALKDVLARRKDPKDKAAHGKLLFVTKRGGSFSKSTSDSPISKEFNKLLKAAEIPSQGRNFYTLRHVFRTIGDRSRDQVACDFIMGHIDSSMAGRYREGIDDARLQAVVDHVHAWLWPDEDGDGDNATPAKEAKPMPADKRVATSTAKRKTATAEVGWTPRLFVG
jgi:integrase